VIASRQYSFRAIHQTERLEVLQDLTHGRADGYQLLDDGLRRNDPETIAKAGKDLKQVEQTNKQRKSYARHGNERTSAV
jgi:hypothetical protein